MQITNFIIINVVTILYNIINLFMFKYEINIVMTSKHRVKKKKQKQMMVITKSSKSTQRRNIN